MSGTRLYVGNLSFDATEADVRAAFEEGGRTVKDCHLPSDRETGRPRGFAFIEMGTPAEASEAIAEMDGETFMGRQLKVNEAKPREPRGGGRR
jgi:RNA recognition motif-containing protein